MSNHDGGYLLNYALSKLDKAGAFESLDTQKTFELVKNIVNYACNKYDCNPGEILLGLSASLEICAYCLEHKEIVYKDFCATCCKDLEFSTEEIAKWQRKNSPP